MSRLGGKRKYFFFEKKKQKTFAVLVSHLYQPPLSLTSGKKALARLREREALAAKRREGASSKRGLLINTTEFFDSFPQKRTASCLLVGCLT